MKCEDYFHQLLYWENEDPRNGSVHHLMVLAYHLQHPSLYSPAGLDYSLKRMLDFIERGISPEQVLKRNQSSLASGKRTWRFRPSSGGYASYRSPVNWSVTIAQVVDAGAEMYTTTVQHWSSSMISDLRGAGNI